MGEGEEVHHQEEDGEESEDKVSVIMVTEFQVLDEDTLITEDNLPEKEVVGGATTTIYSH